MKVNNKWVHYVKHSKFNQVQKWELCKDIFHVAKRVEMIKVIYDIKFNLWFPKKKQNNKRKTKNNKRIKTTIRKILKLKNK